MLIYAIWVLLLAQLLNGTKLSSYTNIPDCSVVYQQLWCSGVGLHRVPVESHIPPNITTYMDISGNKIRKITWELQLYPELDYLTVENNSLTDIHVDAFRHLFKLQELNLAGNLLTGKSLYADTFKSQPNLRILNLSRNNIGPHLQFGLFRYLTSLTYLNLAYNNIVSVSGTEKGYPGFVLHSLIEMSLHDNYIEDIPTVIWPVVPNVMLLDFSRNSFITLPPKSFDKLTQLTSLFLSGLHRLVEVQHVAFNGLQKLEIVHLDNCKYLRVISADAFAGCQNLKFVNFSNNKLKVIQETLLPWGNLQRFLISGNNFICNCSMYWISYHQEMQTLLEGQNIGCENARNRRRYRILDPYTYPGCTHPTHNPDHSRENALLVAIFGLILILVIIAAVVLYRIIKRSKMDNGESYNVHQYWVLD